MNRRTIFAVALCGGLLPAAFAPAAEADNVVWGVSVGGPAFSVAAGQPTFSGARGFYRAPLLPLARPHFRPVYRAVVVAPLPAPFPLVVPAPVLFAPRPLFLARRPVALRSAGYWPAPPMPR
jgi:hypothetical protein